MKEIEENTSVSFFYVRNRSSGSNYQIHVRLKDKAGNSSIFSMPYSYDTDAPVCGITVKDMAGNAISELKNTVLIAGAVDDKEGSGIKDSSIHLRKGTSDVATVYDHATISKTQAFDTESYENGDYTLRLEAEDFVGNHTTIEKAVRIANQFPAPKVTGFISNQTRGTISWEFSSGNMNRLQKLQYRLEEEETWHDISIESGRTGSFAVTLPSREGICKVLVRGVDTAGVTGKDAAAECILDQTAPKVSITSYERGILKGSIQDDYLKKWTVTVTESGTTQSRELLQGTSERDKEEIGIISLNQFEVGHTYTLHLTAWDQAGNKQEASCEFTRKAGEETVISKTADFRIIRPNEQNPNSGHFRIPAMETTLELEQTDGNAPEDGRYLWYLNNEKAGEGKTLTQDFSAGESSGYQEGQKYSIRSVRLGDDGELSYSAAIIQNQSGSHFSVDQNGEAVVNLSSPCVSLLLDGEGKDSQNHALTWKIDVGTGSWQTIVPGTRYDIYTLTGGKHLESSTLKLQVSGSSSVNGRSGTVHVDVMNPETFEVSEIECCYPKDLSVKDALNYKTYLKWSGVNTDQEWPASIRYEVYRGTEPGFTPSAQNLAAKDIQANYWSEININYSERFYYRVRAVQTDEDGKVIHASGFSKEISSAVVDSDEYTKRMGVKEYWEYAEAALPNGNVHIEKSAGNLVYTQDDVEIPNEQLEVTLSRTYNSQSTVKSAFGIGWNHSFDMEILNLCKENSLDFETVVLKDGCGTIYYFDRTGEGTYISSMGKYMNLKKEERSEEVKLPRAGTIGTGKEETVTVNSSYTITTKDNVEYRFNSGGQLVYMAESNGNFLLFYYEPNKGLLSRITTSKNISMEFLYNTGSRGETDPLTVKKISLPDGSFMEYQYEQIASEWHLTQAIHHGRGGEEIHYRMEYLDNGKLSVLYDAMGASYQIGYTGEKVQEFIWPDSEKIRLQYNPEKNQTDTEKLSDGAVVMKETDLFDSYFGNCVKSIDSEGYVTEYTYENNLLDTTSTQTTYQTLENGKVVSHTTAKTEKTTYAENQNITSEKDEDGSITSYTYHGSQAGEVLDDLPKTMKEVDGDGNTLYDNVYQYDQYGNVTSVYDRVNDTTILTEYYTEDDPENGKLKGEVKSEKEILGTAADGNVQSSTSYSYTYDSQGTKTEVVKESLDGITSTTTTVTDVMGRTLHEEEPGKKQTDYVYDGLGRLVKTTCTYHDGATDVTEKRYNDNGALVWEKQPDGTETSYTYDNMNRVSAEVVTKGSLTKEWTTSYGYQTVSIYDGTGSKTVPHAFVTTEKNPDGVITGQSFQDSNGRTVREMTNGIYVDMSYDGQDHVLTKCEVGKKADPKNQLLILYLYDSQGNQTHTLLNPGYDAGSHTFCVTEDTIVTASSYDASGQTVSQTDGEGNTTRFAYDHLGNLTRVELPGEGNITTYQYDVEKEDGTTCDRVIDALGRVSETVENERTLTSLIAEYGDQTTDPITLSSEYDDLDRLIKEQESAGNYRTYEYDSRDRKTAVHSFNAAGKETLRTLYTYDRRDNITSMSDYQVSNGKATLYHYTRYTYDELNRQTGYAQWNGSAIPTEEQLSSCTIQYGYDVDGNITSITYPSKAGSLIRKLTYHYNADKWLTAIKAVTLDQSVHVLREYTYNDNGQLVSICDHRNVLEGTASDATTCHFTYDIYDRVTEIRYTEGGSGEEKESYRYTYNKNNELLTETMVNHYPTSEEDWVEEQRSYTYDSLGRLTGTEITDGLNGTTTEISYTYDKVGNRLTETEDGVKTSYTYNSLNQLLSTKKTGEDNTVLETTSYQYDSNGNQTGQTITPSEGSTFHITLTYDSENRMSQYVKKEGSSITLTQTNRYDGNGQRIQKVEGSQTVNYYYDVDSVLYTTNELDELTAVNHMGTQNNVIATSRFGENQEEALYYYHKDIRESTTNLVDRTGNGVVSYQYTDFGETTAHGQEDFYNEICYTGGIYDAQTELYYLNARYYNPADGRFLTEDTYRGESTDPDTLHLYAYCANNPITKADPSGHIAISRIAGAVIGGAAGGYASYRYAKRKGIRGWKRTALIAGCTIGGAVAGALIGPRVAKVAKRAARVVRKKPTKVYKKVIKKASKAKKKVTAVKRKASNVYRKASCRVKTKISGKPHCFTAHTRIITRSGKKEIQDVKEGDEVPSADPYTGEISYKKVLKTTRSETDTLVRVSVNGETIETTESHPFWVEEYGFVPAYHLKQGDTLRLADGRNISVSKVEILHLDTPVPVYNFTVEDNHTYFVGDSGVWVHNAKCGKTKPKQIHHFATNKNKKFVKKFETITSKYDLDLDGGWNKQLLPHQGRHPNVYHRYVYKQMQRIDEYAAGDKKLFMQGYRALRKSISKNPDMLYKRYWIDKYGNRAVRTLFK